uniref:Dilute domain-containing protein n=1 Tax=Tetradesmus obliquus TaxID=3088 RepID=A0A383WM78_TETOB|eukprot:jgi/Sobl393_1/19095/SZX77836.1
MLARRSMRSKAAPTAPADQPWLDQLHSMAPNEQYPSRGIHYRPLSSSAAAPAHHQLPCSASGTSFQGQLSPKQQQQQQQQQGLGNPWACLQEGDSHGEHSWPVPFLQAPCSPAATLPSPGSHPYVLAHPRFPGSPPKAQQQPTFESPHPPAGPGHAMVVLPNEAAATPAEGMADTAQAAIFLQHLQSSMSGFACPLGNSVAVAAPAAAMDAAEHVKGQDADRGHAAGAQMQATDLECVTRKLQQQLISDKRKQYEQQLAHKKPEDHQLLAALAQPMGFHKGKPLAALVVIRACLQWGAFKADRCSLFGDITQVIKGQIERQPSDNACLAYWLVNTVTLRHLLQRTIKPMSTAKSVAQALGFGTMDPACIDGGFVSDCYPVEAKYPALMFKQQQDEFVQTIYAMMRENVKKSIEPMLRCCIGAPTPRSSGSGSGAAPTAAVQSKAWGDLLAVFDELLVTLRKNHVPKPLAQALFKQLFNFVNVTLSNLLLLCRECC